MIEVMMRNYHFGKRLIRYERACFIDVGLRIGFTAVGFKHRQMVVEFEYSGISSGASQVPNPFGDGYGFDVQPGRRWSRSRSHRIGSSHNGDRSIDDVPVYVELVPNDVSEIDSGVITGWQHEALFKLITDEVGSIAHVAKIVVGTDPTDPRRKVSITVDSQSDFVCFCCREIHKLPVALFTKIAQFRARL